MRPNDGEWGGLGWSINLACLPNDYSSAANTSTTAAAASAVREDANVIHGGFPLCATGWIDAVTLL